MDSKSEPKKRETSCEIALRPAGAVLFWLSLGLLCGGLFSFSGPMVLLGLFGLLLFPLVRWLARAQLDHLSVERRLPHRTFLGDSFPMQLRLTNGKKWLHSSHLEIHDKFADSGGGDLTISLIPSGQSASLEASGRLFRRGWNTESRVAITSTWPLGVFQVQKELPYLKDRSGGKNGILVMPRPLFPKYLRNVIDQIEQEATLFAASAVSAELAEFRALREFRAGDSVKMIHWPASSRSGSLYVKETDPPRPRARRYGVVLHTYSPGGHLVQPERYETILRIAAGLLIRFRENEISVLLAAPFSKGQTIRVPEQCGRIQLLEEMARSRFSIEKNSSKALAPVAKLQSRCEQIFVLGSSPREMWEPHIEELEANCICLDPESVSRKFSRKSKATSLLVR